MSPSRAGRIVAYFLLASVVCVGLLRLQYGADRFDEAYYIAVAYRFALGDTPFVDEVSVPQSAALFTTPFIKAYVWMRGGTGGLVLFSRLLFFCFLLSVGFFLFRFASKRTDENHALLLAALCVCFVPFNIYGLSYNTLGMMGFTLGVLFSLTALDRPGELRAWHFCGFSHAVGVIAYPTLLPAFALHLVCLGIHQKSVRFLWPLLSSACSLGIALCLLYGFTPLDVLSCARESVQFLSQQGYELTESRWVTLASELRKSIPYPVPAFIFTIVSVCGLAWRPKWVLAGVAVALPFALYLLSRTVWGGVGFNGLVLYAGLLFPIFIWLAGNPKHRHWWFTAWVPSLAAALAFSFSSRNGIQQAALGMLAPFYLSIIALWIACRRFHSPGVASSFAALSILGFIALFHYQLWGTTFGDLPPFQLTHRITEGPYAGALTHRERKQFLEHAGRVIERHQNGTGRILIYPFFPAGYLMSGMRPATSTVYQTLMHRTDLEKEPYVVHFKEDFLAVRVAANPLDPNIQQSHLNRFIESQQQTVYADDELRLFTGKNDRAPEHNATRQLGGLPN